MSEGVLASLYVFIIGYLARDEIRYLERDVMNKINSYKYINKVSAQL